MVLGLKLERRKEKEKKRKGGRKGERERKEGRINKSELILKTMQEFFFLNVRVIVTV